jgi:hypothetical protein
MPKKYSYVNNIVKGVLESSLLATIVVCNNNKMKAVL